ncbi:MAG TPA: NAD(P)H-dependent oxidoreductase [Phycisphaerales bacterium]
MTIAPSALAPKPVDAAALLNNLKWRYAVKKFDPTKKIPGTTWQALEHAAVLSPSSFGLQPWRFVVVDDKGLREKLKGVSWNQSQVTDASHLIVFARRTNLGAADVQRYIDSIAATRNVPKESLDGYKNMMLGFAQQPGLDTGLWAAKQVYIALGVFLATAANLGVDACPMEGIDPKQYDELLRPVLGNDYTTLCVAAAGYRASDDAIAGMAKVRYAVGDVVKHV